jgi:hypothetical protein
VGVSGLMAPILRLVLVQGPTRRQELTLTGHFVSTDRMSLIDVERSLQIAAVEVSVGSLAPVLRIPEEWRNWRKKDGPVAAYGWRAYHVCRAGSLAVAEQRDG